MDGAHFCHMGEIHRLFSAYKQWICTEICIRGENPSAISSPIGDGQGPFLAQWRNPSPIFGPQAIDFRLNLYQMGKSIGYFRPNRRWMGPIFGTLEKSIGYFRATSDGFSIKFVSQGGNPSAISGPTGDGRRWTGRICSPSENPSAIFGPQAMDFRLNL